MPVEVALRAVSRGPLRVHEIDFARSFGIDAFLTDRSGGVSEAPFDSLNLALHVGDDEMRRALCSTYNDMHAQLFREYSDRMTPPAMMPLHTPGAAIG